MSRFRFIGDPNDNFSGPSPFTWEGFVFSRTEWTDVPDDLALRLVENNHYECEWTHPLAGNGSALLMQDVSETEESFVSGMASNDIDVRDRLINEAGALGLQIDGRWGLTRLQKTVDEARAAGN